MSELFLALAIGHGVCTLGLVIGGGASFIRRGRYRVPPPTIAAA